MSYQNFIFLITASATYYPNAGTRDWKSAYGGRAAAEEAFRNFACGEHSKSDASLIQLYTDQDGETHWRTLANKRYSSPFLDA